MRAKLLIPNFHLKPLARLQKPTCIEAPENHPPAPLRVRKFHSVVPSSRKMHELVYDPNVRLRSKSPQFSADFEAGNIGQVFQTGVRQYEIHLIPDPTSYYSALWYFFRVESMPPGDYHFTIVGFFRDAHLHQIGVQPVALSTNAMRRGIGWQRHGNEMNFWCWKRGPSAEYALSFTFTVAEMDTMYFAYLYPYTYTDLRCWLDRQDKCSMVSMIGRSHGGIDVPAIFWDGDIQKFLNVKTLMVPQRILREVRKPLIVIAARHHPGESNASFAMEGFMETLFGESSAAKRLMRNFSILILPMMNVDGVVCGYYRPTLTGYDMNRTWIAPNRKSNPIEFAVVSLLDKLVKTRPLVFMLDYHGHTAQCNAFTYGVWNELVPYNEYEGLFPRLMSRNTSMFDEEGSASLPPDSYSSTMRVALHHRYQIPFAYTLEMSFGGLDIGAKSYTQMTPDCYRQIGRASVPSMATMLLDHVPLNAMIRSYVPPIRASARRGY